MELISFKTLYKKNNKGSIQFWKIAVEENVESDTGVVDGYNIITSYGQVDGKVQNTSDTIREGKNIGKANETTPLDQALSEAESMWKYQIDRKGYVENLSDTDKDLRPGAEPMLAQRYDKYPDKIEFPCIVQPKLDGHRMIGIYDKGEVTLWSRNRTPITGLPHINAEIKRMVESTNPKAEKIIFDGEAYNNDYKDKFEELTGFIRSQEPKEGHEVVQYHIYDLVDEHLNQQNRLDVITHFVLNANPNTIQLVGSVYAKNDEDVLRIFKNWRQAGFEGAILRNKDALYVGKRSYDLQKVKEFQDAEFKIVKVEEGRGKMKGHAIFVLNTEEGKEFKAKMKGALENLAQIFQNKDQYIGKFLTVMYQDLTADGIPRFPVGLRVRDDL